MFVEVNHETGQSCVGALAEIFKNAAVGDEFAIQGMKMGDRVIHLNVVLDLINVQDEVCGKFIRTSVCDDGTGWGKVIWCVCVG